MFNQELQMAETTPGLSDHGDDQIRELEKEISRLNLQKDRTLQIALVACFVAVFGFLIYHFRPAPAPVNNGQDTTQNAAQTLPELLKLADAKDSNAMCKIGILYSIAKNYQ
jgi:hypothetical protein